jgi:hypothetical protein
MLIRHSWPPRHSGPRDDYVHGDGYNHRRVCGGEDLRGPSFGKLMSARGNFVKRKRLIVISTGIFSIAH